MKVKWAIPVAIILGCTIFAFQLGTGTWSGRKNFHRQNEPGGGPGQSGLSSAPASGKKTPGVQPPTSALAQTIPGTAPKKAYPMADMGQGEDLKHAQRLDYRDGPLTISGQFQRVSLYRTNMKYPLIRLTQTLGNGPNGTQSVLSQQAAVADHIIVQLQPGSGDAEINKLAAQNGASVIKTPHAGLYLVQLPNATLDTVPNAIQAFSKYPGVLKYAEVDSVVHAMLTPNDPSFSGQWDLNNTGQTSGTAHDDINAENAWSVVNQTPNVIVAVIDSGIDFNHPDLQANIWTNPNPGQYGYANDVHGWNFYANNNDPQDDNFHGTHVSGILGAVGNNGVGISGVTWSVKIVPLKFLDSNGSGFTSDAVNAVYYATSVGAKIISNSWGGGAYSQALKDAIDAANTAGVLFVVAAGNDGTDTDTSPTYPADFTSPNIISVAATDDNDQLASFSNYGTATVELAAPGVGILSTLPTVSTAAMNSDGLPTGYGLLSGTSMATPLVSGAAALALAQNPSLTVAQLKSQIVQRSDTRTQLAGVVQSGGRLDLYNVVNSSYSAGGAVLELSSTTFSDPEGDNSGTAYPGEIIDLTPVIYNAGGTAANNITVQIVSQQSTATVLTNSVSAGTLLPNQSATLPSPFRIQLNNSVAVGTTLTFNVIIQGTGLAPVTGTATVVMQASRGYAMASANFQCGEIKADPGRNIVYAVDLTNNRVLAIDTNLGQLAAAANLDATSGAGQMAVSLDDSKLYVALPTAQKIQVFTLPSLSSIGSLPINFTPYSLACGTGSRLYAGNSNSNWGNIYEVSATSGATLQKFSGGTFGQFYAPLLRTSLDGTKLYEADTELSGYGNITQFDISGASASVIKTYSYDSENLEDFAVDDTNNCLYLMNGGIYGVNVLNLGTGSYNTEWPLGGAYAVGVAFLPTGSVVYGASGTGNVVEYDRSSGTNLQTFAVGGFEIQTRGIAITPNGNVFYVESSPGGGNATFGLIGGKTLQITNPPPVTPGVDLNLASVAFSDTAQGNSDGVPNAGEIVSLTPTIANVGGAAATNVSVSLSSDSNATVLSPTSQTIASVAAGSGSITPASFAVQLGSNVAIGTVVNFTFSVSYGSGPPQTYPYCLVVQPFNQLSVVTPTMQLGEILADQQRDVVYMIDKTDMEILAFDTDAGHITATAPMAGSQSVDWEGQDSGGMAESVDGSFVYVAEPQSNTIQKLALPALTAVTSWTYSFQPVSLACDAQGRLYCSTTDSTQQLVQINGSTGIVLTQTGQSFASSTSLLGSGTLLRRNPAGTELYASQDANGTQCAIYRYSTTGTAAPSQIAVYPIQPVGDLGASVSDFSIDPTGTVFYDVGNNGAVTVIPLSGAASSLWTIPSTYPGGSAVGVLPSGGVETDGYNFPCQINLFSAAGAVTTTYNVTSSNDSYQVRPRGLAVTPNGRTLYILQNYYGGDTGTVDGYDYRVGLIGGPSTIDMQPPGPNPIGLESLAVTDPSPGSNDGFVHPGQTIQIAPVFKNFLNIQITGVSVQLSTTDSLATVQSPSTSSIGNVNSFATFSPSSNFSIAISPSATDGHAIPLNFTVTYDNGAQQVVPYTLYVTSAVSAETQVNFQIGDMLSDPTRDLAYVVDNTHQQLLAIDTDAGTVSKAVCLPSSPGTGHLALSADGSHLYIALTAAQQIQVISLPDMQQTELIKLDFEPYSLAAGADGKLYVSSADNAWEYLRQVDPVSGQTLGTFGKQTYYQSSVLRLSGDHSTLYVAETGLSGYGTIDAYAINSSGLPTYQTDYPFLLANLFDLAIDDTYQRIYSVSGGVYGIGVTDMIKGTTTTWSDSSNYAPYGDAICFLPAGNFIYGGSYGEVRRYNRFDGTPLGDFGFSSANAQLMPRGLAMTPNNHILYATYEWTGDTSVGVAGYIYRLGLIGAPSLTVSPPTAAPAINAGANQTTHLSQATTLTATVTSSTSSLPVTWNVVSGPAGAAINSAGTGSTVSFASAGTYQVMSTATQGSLTGSDFINVTVLPDAPAVSVTAPVTAAAIGGANGQFAFTRTGSPVGALAVAYTVSGTARNGVDYTAALTGTTTIPDGSLSITVPVTALAGGTVNSTVITTVASSASYQFGVSRSATVTIGLKPVIPVTYTQWSGSYTLSTGSTAMPFNDGVPNFLKYLFDIDPTQTMSSSDRAALPILGIDTTTTPGTQYLALTYRENPNISGVTPSLQTSPDLQVWTTMQTPDVFQKVGTAPNGDPMMEIGVKLNGQAKQFLRLTVPTQ